MGTALRLSSGSLLMSLKVFWRCSRTVFRNGDSEVPRLTPLSIGFDFVDEHLFIVEVAMDFLTPLESTDRGFHLREPGSDPDFSA